MDFRVDFQGIARLSRSMEFLGEAMVTQIQGAGLAAAGRVVRRDARRRVPRRTGALARSIRVRRVSERLRGRRITGAATIVFAGGVGARHAALIELGTVRHPAYEYLRPAIEQTQSAQLSELARATGLRFEQVVRRIAAGQVSRTQLRLIGG